MSAARADEMTVGPRRVLPSDELRLVQDARRSVDDALAAFPPVPRDPRAPEPEVVAFAERLSTAMTAIEALDTAISETSWERSSALLGAHTFSQEQVARAMSVGDRLISATIDRSMDAARYTALARSLGLLHQESLVTRGVSQISDRPAMVRLFRLLDLAAQVFDAEVPNMADVTSLRRLSDRIQAGRSRFASDRDIVRLQDLEREFLPLNTRHQGPVTTADLRAMVVQVQAVKTAKGQVSHRPVRLTGLRTVPENAGPVPQARQYLDAAQGGDLQPDQIEALIRSLLAGIVTDEARTAVTGLLWALEPDHLARVFRGGQRPRQLDRVFPASNPLRASLLDPFTTERFGTVIPVRGLMAPLRRSTAATS